MKKELLSLLALVLLSGCAPVLRISSSPGGATLYGGKTPETLRKTSLVTPINKKSAPFMHWESWCYKVTVEGYQDSEIICRPDETKRVIDFQLKKNGPGLLDLAKKQEPGKAAPAAVTTAPPRQALSTPIRSHPAEPVREERSEPAEDYYQLLARHGVPPPGTDRQEIYRLLAAKPYSAKDAAVIRDYALTRVEGDILLLARHLMEGKADKYAVKPLIRALHGEKPETRATAAKYLGDIGAEAKEAVPALETMTQEDLLGVRRPAAAALIKIKAGQSRNNQLETN